MTMSRPAAMVFFSKPRPRAVSHASHLLNTTTITHMRPDAAYTGPWTGSPSRTSNTATTSAAGSTPTSRSSNHGDGWTDMTTILLIIILLILFGAGGWGFGGGP